MNSENNIPMRYLEAHNCGKGFKRALKNVLSAGSQTAYLEYNERLGVDGLVPRSRYEDAP